MTMSKSKLLEVRRIMLETDANHCLTTTAILRQLRLREIYAERKSVLRDIEILRETGDLDIQLHPDNKLGFYVSSRVFEDWELKMLIDATLAANFLTFDQRNKLTSKLSRQSSKAGKATLNLSTISQDQNSHPIPNQDYTMHTIQAILQAIQENCQIEFHYVDRVGARPTAEIKREKKYVVNPYVLIWSADDYYLIGNTEPHDNVSHYRLDRIRELIHSPVHIKSRTELLGPHADQLIRQYTDRLVYMFPGEHILLRLRCEPHLFDDITKRFPNFEVSHDDSTGFTVTIDTADNAGLYFWLLQYGEHITVLKPEIVRRKYLEILESIMEKYVSQNK